MLLRAALVLVLLHLHGSSTLTDTDKEQNVSTQKMKRIRRTVVAITRFPGAVQQKTTASKSQKMVYIPDEDLLDLMVRIAQSPSEWDRIQQVLTKLGEEQQKSVAPELKEDELQRPNLITSGYTNDDKIKDPENSSPSSQSPPSSPRPTTTDYDDHTLNLGSLEIMTKDTGPGWPDFEEAILKKVRISEKKSDGIFQDSLYENDWFDSSWSDFLSENNDNKNLRENLNVKTPAASFVKLNDNEGSSSRRSNHLRKTTYNTSDSYAMLLKENVPTKSGNFVERLSNKSSRPVFIYHRVTTSPQEQKSNSAIIAVSVAHREQDAPSSTQTIKNKVEGGFKRNFERHRNKERKGFKPKHASPEHFRHRTHSHH